jgi:hypothetical protein
VTICDPVEFRVTWNLPVPFTSVASRFTAAGMKAKGSLVVNWTISAKPVTVAPNAFSAVTVISNGTPTVADAGALTTNCVVNGVIGVRR